MSGLELIVLSPAGVVPPEVAEKVLAFKKREEDTIGRTLALPCGVRMDGRNYIVKEKQ